MAEIILASASPRRQELLDQIAIRYHVAPVDADESALEGECAVDLVQRLAKLKAETGWLQSDKLLPVLGADTLGLINNDLLVKPENYESAQQMLRQMSGNWHEILSAVALCYQDETRIVLSVTKVLFRQITDAEILAYWNTGEPVGKAGAYAIQGRGAVFVERIEGSYSGVMGLPLYETEQLLRNIHEITSSR